MAGFDGAWDCVAETPMGEQRFTMVLARDGDGLTAHATGAFGTTEITGCRVEGDTLSWSMPITMPMPMTLIGRAVLAGDRLEGGITAGGFGTFPIEGTRA